jgi:hypothetical protein
VVHHRFVCFVYATDPYSTNSIPTLLCRFQTSPAVKPFPCVHGGSSGPNQGTESNRTRRAMSQSLKGVSWPKEREPPFKKWPSSEEIVDTLICYECTILFECLGVDDG